MLYTMKLFSSFGVFMLVLTGLCTAQTNKPPTTADAPNRRQELYDQYHGITKKSASKSVTSTAPVSPSVTKRAQKKQPALPVSRPTPPPAPVATPMPVAERAPMEASANSMSGSRIGFRGGVTYPVFTDSRPYTTPSIGFTGGVTFTFGRGGVAFQPEINYTRYSFKNDVGFGSSRLGADFVEVPLLLKLSTGTYADSRFFLNIGPYASYASSTSIDGKKVDISGLKGRFGFGAAAGIGAALKAGPGHLTIEVRGLYSLGNTDTGFSTDANTILGQGTLGYIFPLGGH